MDKLFDYIFPFVAGVAFLGALFGYFYLSSTGPPQIMDSKVREDKEYLSSNAKKYADCHYTVEIGDFSIATVTNKYFNQGISKEKLLTLEKEFKEKYEQDCEQVLEEYKPRYDQYQKHKKEAAEAELSQIDKWLGNEAEVMSDPSPIFSLYQRYDPKSLQHPTNPDAKMLYSQKDYEEFVMQNL